MVKSLQRSLEAKLASIEGVCADNLELSYFSPVSHFTNITFVLLSQTQFSVMEKMTKWRTPKLN